MDVQPVVGRQKRDVLRQRGALRLSEAQLAGLLLVEGWTCALLRASRSRARDSALGELAPQVECPGLQLGVLVS